MKKVLLGIIVLLSFLSLNVQAEDYDLYQLIPINTKATVETDHFIYQDLYYNDNEMQREYLNNNHIIIPTIKNKTKEEIPVSISVGFFDKDKKNIGTLNYCSTKEQVTFAAETIGPEGTVPYSMVVTKADLIEGKKMSDIAYVAVLGENWTCSTGKASENAGRTAEEIQEGNPTNKENLNIDDSTKYFLYAVGGGILLLLIFFWFRSASTGGMTRDEVIREEYKLRHQQNLENRKPALEQPQPQPQQPQTPQPQSEEPKPTQEESLIEETPKENTENNDLMNMFK